MKQLHFIPLWSIVPLSLHNMKHSLRSYDEKMKNESFSACNTILSTLYYCQKGKLIMEKSSNKLIDLSVTLAVEILNLVKYLKSQHETIICNQIGRAGTSIGANIHEAQYAHGKADFCLFAVLWQKLISLLNLKFPVTDIFSIWRTHDLWSRMPALSATWSYC